MDEIVTALAEQHAELDALLSPLDDDGWRLPSRCPGWSVADVVLHLAQTDELAIASASGQFGDAVAELASAFGAAGSVDEGAGLLVDRERGAPPAALHERWRAASAGARQALLAHDPSDRLTWVAGELSARTLATTRLAEAWIHTGDVAEPLGVVPQPSARLRHIARLAWRTLPYAFARAGRELSGPVAFELRGPDGDEWRFAPDGGGTTTIRGDALDLCLVAARRVDAGETALEGDGPDGAAVLELVRTFA